jgi:hypothetical protein
MTADVFTPANASASYYDAEERVAYVDQIVYQVRALRIAHTRLLSDPDNLRLRVHVKRGAIVINTDIDLNTATDLYDVRVYKLDMHLDHETYGDVVAHREYLGVCFENLPQVVSAID